MRAPFALLLSALLLSACDREERAPVLSARDSLVIAEEQGEYVTIQGVDFPEPVARAAPEIQEAYIFAAKHPEILRYMPCYCGCENESPPHHPPAHASNYDCFVDQIDRSGERPRVDIDAMGFG